tara:strand:- start:412 stop:1581 length:1170 start_codon:yes stop_codon:yes gene_type:complete
MALSKLSEDEQRIVFTQLCNVLDPGVAVAFSSASSELWALTQAMRQQLKAEHEAATALCLKVGMRSCKELREAKEARWQDKGLTAADLGLLGTLGSVLPALEKLRLIDSSAGAGPDGVLRLAEGLSAGALPSVTTFEFVSVHVGDAGASALAAALGRGALPRLKHLHLSGAAITEAGLVALAPALRQLPALERLGLVRNPFGDEGLAALMGPPLLAGALSPPTGALTKLKRFDLRYNQISDAGCAALTAALNSGVLPALDDVHLEGIPASAAAKRAVREALTKKNTVRLDIKVPSGANVGDRLTFNTAAGQFSLVVPAGAAPGKTMMVTLPVPANFRNTPQLLLAFSGLRINGQLPVSSAGPSGSGDAPGEPEEEAADGQAPWGGGYFN